MKVKLKGRKTGGKHVGVAGPDRQGVNTMQLGSGQTCKSDPGSREAHGRPSAHIAGARAEHLDGINLKPKKLFWETGQGTC